MKHRHISMLAVNAALFSFLFTTTAFASAHPHKNNYKGEISPCPASLALGDGVYLGATIGYDNYRVKDNLNYLTSLASAPFAPVYLDSKLGVNGVFGGGFIGYGQHFDNFYNTYLGLEISGNWSGAQLNYSQSANTTTASTTPLGTYLITEGLETNIKVKNNYGISILPGIKLNDAALVYVRLGYNWAHVEVNQTITNTASFLDTFGTVVPSGSELLTSSTNNTSGGFTYGVGIESALLTNLSVRTEYTHTSYKSFSVSQASNSIHPTDNQFSLGVIYYPGWV